MTHCATKRVPKTTAPGGQRHVDRVRLWFSALKTGVATWDEIKKCYPDAHEAHDRMVLVFCLRKAGVRVLLDGLGLVEPGDGSAPEEPWHEVG